MKGSIFHIFVHFFSMFQCVVLEISPSQRHKHHQYLSKVEDSTGLQLCIPSSETAAQSHICVPVDTTKKDI